MEELRARVYGRVQMVMFRDFTRRNALSLGLVGTVQNLSDGTVAVVAQGTREALEALLKRLHKGSLFSKVVRIEDSWGVPDTHFDTFSIEY